MTEIGYSRPDEGAHPAGQETLWQESVLLTWLDGDRGIGGFHRLGHEVNTGAANVWCGLVGPDGWRWRDDRDGIPLAAGDRTSSMLRSGGQSFDFDIDGRNWLRYEAEDALLEIEFEDSYPAQPLWEHGAAAVGRETIPNHVEASGRARGRMRVGDEKSDVDGWYHRDHSWGPRDWARILGHRWVAGTCGPELSFSAIQMLGADEHLLQGAAVVRQGCLTAAMSVDITAVIEPDAISVRGGHVELGFDGGERLNIDLKVVEGFVFDQREHVHVDALCRFTASDGTVGFADLEVSNGLRRPVGFAVRAVTAPGLSRV
jgi:hypothetical protein